MTDLVDEFRRFLGSVKTSEALSQELRPQLSVHTGLEAAFESAIRSGRDVVVAGSAGGGKTHLIESIQDHAHGLPQIVQWNRKTEPAEPFIRVIPDATALPRGQRASVFRDRPNNCVAVVLAINEGPLLELARAGEVPFAEIVRMLHSAQRGIYQPTDHEVPVVLDAGGFDPLRNGVLRDLLALPLAKEVVDSEPCSCEDPRICPRRLSWAFLSSDKVRQRVNDLLQLAGLGGQPILFRDLWDFVADLILGGSCQDDPPTSAWFWRVFYGASALSRRLTEVADPGLIVFPRLESRLWYGDWLADDLDLMEGAQIIPLAEPSKATDRYKWLKAQLFFLTAYESVNELIRDQVDLELASAVETGNKGEVVGAINRYVSYGTRPPIKQVLDLWIDLGVERRQDRARGQASLGSIPTSSLEIRRALVVANHPDETLQVFGTQQYLVHPQSEAAFRLSPESLSLIRGGRSYRTADRPHTDMEWHLARFFASAAGSETRADQLHVMELDFRALSSRVRSYRLSLDQSQIEPE